MTHKKQYTNSILDASGSIPFYFYESSPNVARALYKDFRQHDHLPAMSHALTFGVAIGSVQKKGYPPNIVLPYLILRFLQFTYHVHMYIISKTLIFNVAFLVFLLHQK